MYIKVFGDLLLESLVGILVCQIMTQSCFKLNSMSDTIRANRSAQDWLNRSAFSNDSEYFCKSQNSPDFVQSLYERTMHVRLLSAIRRFGLADNKTVHLQLKSICTVKPIN